MTVRFFFLLLLCCVIIISSPFFGMVTISPWILGSDDFAATVFWTLRVPRVIVGFVAGSALALSGMVFQAMFRNPLATPDTLGVSSGAAFGAAVTILFGLHGRVAALPVTAFGAFCGALLAIAMVYAFSSIQRRISNLTMLLAGIAVGFLFSSMMMLAQYFSDLKDSFQIVRWLMGGLEGAGYGALPVVLPVIIAATAAIIVNLAKLNLLMTGEDLAQSRGVNVARTKATLFLATSLIVAAVVASCGPIAFVGMMTPHICRMIFGSDHRISAPATLVAGGAFLVSCDTLARIIVAPSEMPAGILTALMGGPFFLWILFRSMKRRVGGELW